MNLSSTASMARVRAFALTAFTAIATACSSASSSTTGQLPVTVTSDSGSLHVELSASPPPIVGTNRMELTVTRASSGAPLDGLSVSVVPWMPSMDHGTASPTVTAEGGGKYAVTDLYFFMPGTWVLKTTLAGPVSDHAEPTFELQ